MSTIDGADERAMFGQGPVVVFRWRNADGWPVDYVSSNVRDVLGYSPDEFVSGAVSYASLVHEADLPRVASEVTRASEAPVTSFEHEPYRVRRRDGQQRWFYDFTNVVRDERGRATHFDGYIIDITRWVHAEAEKQELERRLLHAQKLESLGVLAGGVAHDFNNLLTAILGQVGIVRRELDRRDVELAKVRHGVEQIDSIGKRAADLTRQLLAYSGRGSRVVEPVHLGALVREMASILDVARSKKATLHQQLSDDTPLIVADRSQMQQVVLNLLTNASEALGDKPGTITVRTSRAHFTARDLRERLDDSSDFAEGTYAVLEVEDTGVGMTEEQQRRLFEPFFTTKFAGRGLGLSAVLGIVRAHRGAIRTRSTVGRGTSFFLAFPAADVERVSHPPPLASPPLRGSGAILVADDESFVRRTLASVLGAQGFVVIEADNGAEAIARYREQRDSIVLAILDMTMPELSGVEVLRALRAIDPTLRVVLSSGYSDVAANLFDEQPTAFLQKPYTLEELEAVLRSVID
ncbi:MAG: PAS domain-containing protein [Myxococcales bacterium]|nr:PAS domain-containing protein [Myxococcales bacterium]